MRFKSYHNGNGSADFYRFLERIASLDKVLSHKLTWMFMDNGLLQMGMVTQVVTWGLDRI